jgi:hypothetical protein
MAIDMGGFKEKAATAKAEKAAQEAAKAEAERAAVELAEAEKGREGEIIGRELEAASQEFVGAEASLAEARQFEGAEDFAALTPEDQEAFRAQVAAEQQRADELKLKIAELQARKQAMEVGPAAEMNEESATEEPEAAKENLEDLDVKELGQRLTQLGKDSRIDREALEKAMAEAAEDPSRVEEVERLRNKIGEGRESFLSASGVFLEKLSQEKPGMVEQQYQNIDNALARMQQALGRRLKSDGNEGGERLEYSIEELTSKLRGVDALIKSQNPNMDEKELEGQLIAAQSSVIDKTRTDEKDPAFKALMQGLYDRSLKTRFVHDKLRQHLRPLSP